MKLGIKQCEKIKRTYIKETDNERSNGPKERMEGGDLTDDIDINDPEARAKNLKGIMQHQDKIELGFYQ